MIYSLMLIIAVVLLHAVQDWYRIEKSHLWINHTKEALLITIPLFLCFALLTNFNNAVCLIVLYAGTNFMFYDLVLNKLRGLPLTYTGKYSDKQSWTDRWLSKVRYPYLLKTFIFVVITVTVYLILKH